MMQAILIGQVSAILPWTVLFPLDVAKSSLQIQGELQSLSTYRKLGIYGILKKIYTAEGLRGCYRGFMPVVCLTQINGVRLGLYDYAKQLPIPPVVISAILGYISGWLGNPFIMIKTRIQCGHKHEGLRLDLMHLYESGTLFKGAYLASLKWGLKSLVQLPTFDFMMEHTHQLPELERLALSSFTATFTMVTLGQPLDIVMTRVYNQKGTTYTGFFQGLLLIATHEGFTGLFKGYMANCITFGPSAFTQLLLYQYFKGITMID